MFEDRNILLLSYNKETLLAEKMQTILVRGIANTRLRDFYDVYEVMKMYAEEVDKDILLNAFHATCEKRETVFSDDEVKETLEQLKEDGGMEQMWEQFRKNNYYVGDLRWGNVISYVVQVISESIIDG